MKKVFVLVLALVLVLSLVGCGKDTSTGEEKASSMIPSVMVNGVLYLDTGRVSDALRCGVMDGEITSTVDSSEVPTEDNQSNFGTGFGYQYGPGDTIEVYINDTWCIFAIDEPMYEKVAALGKIEGVDMNTLVKFDGTVYAQSYAVIDYAGGGENLGTVRMVTDSDLVPYWHCETNNEILRDAWVCENTGNCLILCVDGEYRLFTEVE